MKTDAILRVGGARDLRLCSGNAKRHLQSQILSLESASHSSAMFSVSRLLYSGAMG